MRLEHQTWERSIGRFLDPRSLRHTSSCQASEGKRNQTFTAVGIIFSVQLTSAAGSDLRPRRFAAHELSGPSQPDRPQHRHSATHLPLIRPLSLDTVPQAATNHQVHKSNQSKTHHYPWRIPSAIPCRCDRRHRQASSNFVQLTTITNTYRARRDEEAVSHHSGPAHPRGLSVLFCARHAAASSPASLPPRTR